MDAQLPGPLPDSNDVFSLTDQVLSDRLQFIEEIGFGNWGSVWLCRPKSSTKGNEDGFSDVTDQKIAVKLVHRSKTPTTAARVRSLWNEMKIVRTFKSDSHPSIVPFHSFIITPSYALITMDYLPTLVPVEVDEPKARQWFRYLLSGVEFLHKRGVVHNDIKPANILLSRKNIPVLVDFGFAEKYDLKSDTAFHSNLSYGTPEYLSPERARGLPHDTRKSDVWSLGVTLFEILIGRTPFEKSDGEQFITKEDLERYWGRTLRGKWVGEWHMSKGMERILRRMIAPNADLRCTATQAMNDPYWAYLKERTTSPASSLHRRSLSYTSSVIFKKDSVKLMEAARPFTEGENFQSPPGLDRSLTRKPSKEPRQIPPLTRVTSPSKMTPTKPTPRKRIQPIGELSPVKASPHSSPISKAAGKENIRAFNALAATTASPRRAPLGNIANRDLPSVAKHNATAAAAGKKDLPRRSSRVLGEVTTRQRHSENVAPKAVAVAVAKKDPVRDRVKEWERERQRMREMERLEEIQRELDEEIEEEREEQEEDRKKVEKEKVEREERETVDSESSRLVTPATSTPSTPAISHAATSFTTESSRHARHSSVNDSSVNIFKHSIRKSIDMTMSLYKSSAAQLAGRSTPMLTFASTDDGSKRSVGRREPWEDDILLHNAPHSLSSVRQAARDEQVAADARMDRMAIWMRNVEKVVEDARQTFASSSTHELKTLPSLPVAPLSRSATGTNRSSRFPRKILTASQIFANTPEQSFNNYVSDSFAIAAGASSGPSVDPPVQDCSQLQLPGVQTPSRKRRATVSICSPEMAPKVPVVITSKIDSSPSPSKRREKSRSHGNLFQTHIAPISILEAEANKSELPLPPSAHRLSEVLDSNLFIAPLRSPQLSSFEHDEHELDMGDISVVQGSASFHDLDSSPLHVEAYPKRRASMQVPAPDTPTQRRIEGVYDRFLMATSGVKRVGKGYQSEHPGVTSSVNSATAPPRQEKKLFHATRRPMPAGVSSDVQRLAASVDELGVTSRVPVSSETVSGRTVLKDDGKTTVALVRRAFKAMVPNKTTSKRVSRTA